MSNDRKPHLLKYDYDNCPQVQLLVKQSGKENTMIRLPHSRSILNTTFAIWCELFPVAPPNKSSEN